MVWAVILAAGESRRMGSFKPLLPFKDSTMIEAVVETVAAAGIPRTLVVLGREADRVRDTLRGRDLEFAENPDYKLSMLSSVQCGFRTLPFSASAALVLLADQPKLPVSTIRSVMRAGLASAKGLAVPVFRGRRGHPLFVRTTYKEEILGLDPGVGLRQLLERHRADVLEVEVDDPAFLDDIDTPEDYRRATRGDGK